MKRCRAAEPSGITGPRTPPTFRLGPATGFQLWSPADGGGEGRRLPEPGPGRVCVAGAGLFRDARDFSLQACVCLPLAPGALSAPPGRLGPKLISVLWLDGFSTSCLFWFFVFWGFFNISWPLRALFFTTQKALGIRLSEVPMFPISGCSSIPIT